jgi:hypothetical protein
VIYFNAPPESLLGVGNGDNGDWRVNTVITGKVSATINTGNHRKAVGNDNRKGVGNDKHGDVNTNGCGS